MLDAGVLVTDELLCDEHVSNLFNWQVHILILPPLSRLSKPLIEDVHLLTKVRVSVCADRRYRDISTSHHEPALGSAVALTELGWTFVLGSGGHRRLGANAITQNLVEVIGSAFEAERSA